MWVLEWLFIGVTLIQVLIWVLFPMQLVIRPAVLGLLGPFPAVSVVICARNEAQNLNKHLPMILAQDYPGDWEVVVVDDASTDDTRVLLEELALSNTRLRVISIKKKENPGKKQALAAGIEAAQYKWLALTDADCQPASPRWLSYLMRKANEPGTNLILGYAPMVSTGKFFNKWVRFETLYTALQYLSTAQLGWPFMGVGRNMAYQKSLFTNTGGFSSHAHIIGGDDDLLVNKAGVRAKTAICTAPDSFMYSPAKSTISAWLHQKTRHLNAGKHYKTWHNLVLGGVAFTHAAHYGVGTILLVVNQGYWLLVLWGYFFRQMLIWPIMWQASRRFGEKKIAVYIPILDGLMAVWLGAVAPVLLMVNAKKTSWR